jgi:diguanylate cyclase (GGDEF)-like protein
VTADVGGAAAVKASAGGVLRRNAMRYLVWVGFVVLAAVYLGADSLPLSPVGRFLVAEAAFVLPLSLTIVTGLVAYSVSGRFEARFWALLTGTNAVLLVSELYYIWWIATVSVKGPPPVYAPFQILHVAAAGLFFSMVLTLSKFPNASVMQRIRYGTDVAAIAVVLFAVFFAIVDPLLAPIAGKITAATRVWAALYPMWGVVILLGVVLTLVGFKVTRWRSWEKAVAVAIALYAIGVITWPLWLVSAVDGGPSLQRGVLDLLLVLGDYLLVVATVYRLTAAEDAWPLRPAPLFQPARTRRGAVMMPALMLLFVPLGAWRAFVSPVGSLPYVVFLVVTALMAALAVGRSALVAVENGNLMHGSETDTLSGLFNHRFFFERLAVEVDIASRYDEQLAVVVIDIDDFDLVNNVYGHPAGDDLLRAVARAIKSACRDSDTVCRLGGDEFGVILPETGAISALGLCLDLERRIHLIDAGGGTTVTVSIGIAVYPDHASDSDDLVRKADGALYWVKCHGKDQTLVYDPDVVTDLDAESRIRSIEEQTHLGTVRALAAAVDARDPLTQYHSRNVAALAVLVARELGMAPERVRMIEMAAVLHDIGKIGVTDEILTKPGPLTEEEWVLVREHSALGERILASTSLDVMLPWIRYHHERWDGSGYPDGLAAVAIPLEARVLAVCDAYDAMVNERPYRPARSRAEAQQELVACMGSQFDPAVVEVFIRMLGKGDPIASITGAPVRLQP